MFEKILANKIYKKLKKENFDIKKITLSIVKALQNEKVIKEYNNIACYNEKLVPVDKVFICEMYEINNIVSKSCGYLSLYQKYTCNPKSYVIAILKEETYNCKTYETIPLHKKIEISDNSIHQNGDLTLRNLHPLNQILNTKYVFIKDLLKYANQLDIKDEFIME